MSAKKVLFIAQEISPYLPDTLLSLNSRQLPQAIQEVGYEIRTFMPRFGSINERRNQLHEVIRLSGLNIIIDDTDHPLIIKVASIMSARMQIYFIDNDDFFRRRHTVSDENGVEFDDNEERSIFYIRGVLETMKKLRWMPDVIHCMGWMSAITPLYIKTAYADDPCFKQTKVVYSLYKDDFVKPFSGTFHAKLKLKGIPAALLKEIKNKTIDYEELTKMAVNYSDGVVQCEPDTNEAILNYVKELDKKFMPYNGIITDSVAELKEFYENL